MAAEVSWVEMFLLERPPTYEHWVTNIRTNDRCTPAAPTRLCQFGKKLVYGGRCRQEIRMHNVSRLLCRSISKDMNAFEMDDHLTQESHTTSYPYIHQLKFITPIWKVIQFIIFHLNGKMMIYEQITLRTVFFFERSGFLSRWCLQLDQLHMTTLYFIKF